MGYLDMLSKETLRQPPEGAFSVSEARAAAKTLGNSTIQRKLAADAASGRLETGVFLVGGHNTRYYWEAKDVKVRKR